MSIEREAGWLEDAQWEEVVGRVPIACIDLLPVTRDAFGNVDRIGLILRDGAPSGVPVWCHLGGRVRLGETLTDAAHRHLAETLLDTGAANVGTESFFVNQYFPTPVAGAGRDNRKHAISSCYLVEFAPESAPRPRGEALAFQWFTATDVPSGDDLWPGCELMLERVEIQPRWNDMLETYGVVSDREISHNGLMWQTPVLAMTAIAFLMTIALGSNRDWERALAAFLSTTVAAVSVQLMAKHSIGQIADADALWAIERRRHMFEAHAPFDRRPFARTTRHTGATGWLASKKSRDWWIRAMTLFGAVSAVVFFLAMFGV